MLDYCPDRWTYLETLSSLDRWAIGQERTALATVRALNQHVGRTHGIAWHVGSPADLEPGDATVGATYDPSLDESQEEIFIDAWVNMGGMRTRWEHHDWDQFKRTVADVICHEYIHSHQYKTGKDHRSRKVPAVASAEEKERIYLSDPDEIDAYAHNVAAEMFDYWGLALCKDAMKEWHKSVVPPPATPSIHLWTYANAFGHDLRHPVMKKLMRRAKSYMSEIRLQYLTYQVGE